MPGQSWRRMRTGGIIFAVSSKVNVDAQRNGAPGAIPTRDLPLTSRIHEPFVFNSYEKPNNKACAYVAYCA